jgi:amidase
MIDVYPEPPVFSLGRRVKPVATVRLGGSCRFHTTDEGYRQALKNGLDSDPSVVQRLNALTGPVIVEGVRAGDTLEVSIEQIELGDVAFAVYVDRWGFSTFGMRGSWIEQFEVAEGNIRLNAERSIRVRPMIGCAGVAPSTNSLSALSPTSPHGGNMDLRQLEVGSRLLLPVAVDGALFALGDLHAAMGQGEPAGAGFECAGTVMVSLGVRPDIQIQTPRIETSNAVYFLGVDRHDLWAARRQAIATAWRFLTEECEVDRHLAFAILSGLLQVEFGGPAGANVLASFRRSDLEQAGVRNASA